MKIINTKHAGIVWPSFNLTALDITSVSDCRLRTTSPNKTVSKTKSDAYFQPPRSLLSLPLVSLRYLCKCKTPSLALSHCPASMLERIAANKLSISEGLGCCLGSMLPGTRTMRFDACVAADLQLFFLALKTDLVSRVAIRAHSSQSTSLCVPSKSWKETRLPPLRGCKKMVSWGPTDEIYDTCYWLVKAVRSLRYLIYIDSDSRW